MPSVAPTPSRLNFSLRGTLLAASAILSLLSLLACMSLVSLTAILRKKSDTIVATTESMASVEAVRIHLLEYGRQSDLAFLTRNSQYELARAETKAALLDKLSEARAKAASERQTRLLDQARRRIDEFLAARNVAETGERSVQQVIVAASVPLQAALDALRELVQIDLASVKAAHDHAVQLDAIGNAFGTIVGGLVFLGFLAVLFGMHRLVYSPMVRLTESIARFAGGDKESRAPSEGPRELYAIAGTFNQMADRIVRQYENQLTFLAGVAHDLRTPLTALKLSAQLIAPDRPLPDERKVRRMLAIVCRQIVRLERMVGDFLDRSLIEAGHLELRLDDRDLGSLSRDIVELHRASSTTHDLVLSLPDMPLIAHCDPTRIDQVLDNLISNAIKYSPEGETIRIDLSRREDDALISVSDSGIGISETDLRRIFEPFHRTRVARDSIPGVGLGLSVAKHIIEAHGGRIEVESKPGAGSTFSVLLPLTVMRHLPSTKPLSGNEHLGREH